MRWRYQQIGDKIGGGLYDALAAGILLFKRERRIS